MMGSESSENLKALMMTGLRIQWEIENSSKPQQELQERIKQGILILEDATRLVSILDIFSENEVKDEILTEYLPFLLLPALLGNLNIRLASEDRIEVLKNSRIYYEDFLQRCHNYDIIDFTAPKIDDSEDLEPPRPSGPPNLAALNAEREDKIRKYKQKKTLEEDTAEMHSLVFSNSISDEDTLRTYYLNMIYRFALVALEELNSYASEVKILKYMAKMKNSPQGAAAAKSPPAPTKEKFKPIIITRDEAQKKVFGLGYSSIPVMSVEEFYEQRVRDGWFPSPEEVKAQQSASLMDKAANQEKAKLEEEEEEREKEEKIERDDEENLMRMRAMDDYRDEHKRGEGNRHNKG